MNEVEMDIMYNGSCVPADQNEADVLEHVPDCLGYAYVFVDPVYDRFMHPRLKHKLEHNYKHIQVQSISVKIRICLYSVPKRDMHRLRAKEIKDSPNSQAVPNILFHKK